MGVVRFVELGRLFVCAAVVAGGCSTGEQVRPKRDYSSVEATVESNRVDLARRYRLARSGRARDEVLAQARKAVVCSIRDELIPFWYGTAWDYNGTTQTPRSGKIACGYFVTTVLRHAGFRIDRRRLAQMASENMIKALTSERHIKRFRNRPIKDFVAAISAWGPGLYIVGLDTHTGFIVNAQDGVFFIHSCPFRGVVRELGVGSRILKSSRYRVAGKISADDELIAEWLTING